jgi:hypothetical protein
MTPYVCIQCGVGAGGREWFVDLGFSIDHYFDTANNAVYLCNECYHGMTLDVGRLLINFRKDHEKWNSGEAPTYSWMEEHYSKKEVEGDVREPQSIGSDSGVAEDQPIPTGISDGSDRNNQDTESDDSKSESTDSGDAVATDDSDSDATALGVITFGKG